METSFRKIKIFSYSLIVSFVLLGNLMFAILSYHQNYNAELLSFNANASLISNYMNSADVLDYQALTEYTSTDYQILLSTKEQNSVISYGSLLDADVSQTLPSWARNIAISQYSFGRSVHDGSVPGSNYVTFKESYRKIPLLVYYHENSVTGKNVTIIHTLDNFLMRTRKSFVIFCLLSLVLMALLFLVSYIVIWMAMKPIQESYTRQNEFISAASHELRSPIHVILSSLSVLDAAKEDPKTFARHHQIAISECRRMSQLIDNMLLLAKTNRQDISAQYTCIHPEDLLLQCYDNFSQIVTEKGLHLQLELPSDSIPKCNLDTNLTIQILSILIDNAISYTTQGSITLKLSYDNHYLYYSVIDTGCGIPESMRDKIFEKFYSVDTSHTDKTHCGLGLSIAHDLLDICHGKIQIADNPNGGSIFTILFARQHTG